MLPRTIRRAMRRRAADQIATGGWRACPSCGHRRPAQPYRCRAARPSAATATDRSRPRRRRSATIPFQEKTLLSSRHIPGFGRCLHAVDQRQPATIEGGGDIVFRLGQLLGDRLHPKSLRISQPNQFALIIGQLLDALVEQSGLVGQNSPLYASSLAAILTSAFSLKFQR